MWLTMLELRYKENVFREMTYSDLLYASWQLARTYSFLRSASTVQDNMLVFTHPLHLRRTPLCLFPFPNTKIRLKGRRFDDTTETQPKYRLCWVTSRNDGSKILPAVGEALGAVYNFRRRKCISFFLNEA
jgi:hypothetical protein